MKKFWIIVLVVVVIAGLMGVSIRNQIVTRDEDINAAWAQVETVLQRRYDLIPNLVNTVKGYASHEREVFEEVTRLRSQWGQAKNANEKVQAANELDGAIGRLLLVSENYPELKANQNFVALQDELSGTENRISVERRRYNESVRSFNTYIRRWPNSSIAAMMGMERRDAYFEADQAAAAAPKVEF
ncbi:MAG: LemA family protein [Verrucomicrobia bacterium ADurb.Bin345]|nr:MAG: LemA family protein [Verrucomicrobia bacterium ADurb.Bin345]